MFPLHPLAEGRKRLAFEGWPRASSKGWLGMPGDAKVLVVEDNATVRRALAELIQFWGYSLETASDGLEALSKVSSSPPAVMISDLEMPGMGGLELLKALQNSAPHVNCIIVSAHANAAEEAGLACIAGVVDILEKPVDVQRLRQDLRGCFEPRGAPARSPPAGARFRDGERGTINSSPPFGALNDADIFSKASSIARRTPAAGSSLEGDMGHFETSPSSIGGSDHGD